MNFENGLVFELNQNIIAKIGKQNKLNNRERERVSTWATYLCGPGAGPAQLADASRLPPLARRTRGVCPPCAPTRLATSCLPPLLLEGAKSATTPPASSPPLWFLPLPPALAPAATRASPSPPFTATASTVLPSPPRAVQDLRRTDCGGRCIEAEPRAVRE